MRVGVVGVLFVLWIVGVASGGISEPRHNRGLACKNVLPAGRMPSSVANLKIYVYPLEGNFNNKIFESNKGWVLNEWNQHNQYIPEYVIHQTILHSPLLTTNASQANLFFIPMYGRMGLYRQADLHKLRRSVLHTLSESPWFSRYRGCDHVLVWSSQRRVSDVLGDVLGKVLRSSSYTRFLAVEPFDTRYGVLDFDPSWDIHIPPFVSQAFASHSPTVPRDLPCFYAGTETNSGVRKRMWHAFPHAKPSDTGKGYELTGEQQQQRRQRDDVLLPCVIETPLFKMRQENDASSEHAIQTKTAIQRTAVMMQRSVFCPCPRGLTPGTRRVFEAIAKGCIPVIISDDFEFPFPHLPTQLVQNAFVRVKQHNVDDIAVRLAHVLDSGELLKIQASLAELKSHMLYAFPLNSNHTTCTPSLVEGMCLDATYNALSQITQAQ